MRAAHASLSSQAHTSSPTIGVRVALLFLWHPHLNITSTSHLSPARPKHRPWPKATTLITKELLFVQHELALHHPAADRLLQYATKGCPAETGQDWTVEMIQAAIDRGPHKSAMSPAAMAYIQSEAFDKERIGKARIVEWSREFKRSPPAQLKVSPIAAIPHKSRAFWSILDLSFILRLLARGTVLSVNMNTVKTAPQAAINQIGHVLKRLIHAFAEAPEDAKIFMAKWDV